MDTSKGAMTTARHTEITRKSGHLLWIAALLLAVAPASASGSAASVGCPLRFDQPTIGLPRTCLFVGRFNTPGSTEVLAAFAGDGSTFVVALARGDATPLLYLPAAATSPTAGDLLRWRDGIRPAAAFDAARLSEQVTGTVTLEDGGRRLRLRAAPRPDSDDPAAEFVGSFLDMVDADIDPPVVSQR